MSKMGSTTCVPVPLDSKTLASVTEKAKHWALLHGFSMWDNNLPNKDNVRMCRFVLPPSPFPRTEFIKAVELQPILNKLMFKPISLGVFRSDYMLHTSAHNRIKQVEFNTMCAGPSYPPTMSSLSRFILTEFGQRDTLNNIPENHVFSEVCASFIKAHDLFGVPNAIIIFLVRQHGEGDRYFHRAMEYYITEKRPDIQIYIKSMKQIYEETTLNDKKQLILEDRPVSVVYCRWGGKLRHNYPMQCDWEAKLRIERSTAIKCPPIQYHLAGTKKVQQALAVPGVLERFLTDPDEISRVRDTFVGLHSLDFDDSGERAVQMALDDPDRFVLKSEGEGGGNNFFNAEIKEVLTRMRHSRERPAYILMEKILPPTVPGYIVSSDVSVPPLENLVSELGIFGIMMSDGQSILSNQQVGYCLRTKRAEDNEIGILQGFGAFDSPFLYD